MADFSEKPVNSLEAAVALEVDKALLNERAKETPRDYLGGSRLGHVNAENPWDRGCERALYYEYTHAPKDDGRGFGADLYRVFDMGHDAEERLAEYFRYAGFDLRTEKADGGQFGFAVAKDPATGVYRIRGHVDGIFMDGPKELSGRELTYPFLWETKGMKDKKFKDFVMKGVVNSHPIYYSQVQIYSAFMQLNKNPALFTAINRDTGQIGYEFVPFDEPAAQASYERGLKIVSSKNATELSRISRDETSFSCRFCDYKERCWSEKEVVARVSQEGVQKPDWLAAGP